LENHVAPHKINVEKKAVKEEDQIPLHIDINKVTNDQGSFRVRNNEHDSKLTRPRLIKDEVNVREPLYVGVVTAVGFLNTRATVVNRTWAKDASKVEFYAAASKDGVSLPVVSLPDVDDSYPPQKKVYRMLAYMHDHYINQYNWFLRADDDAYIRVPELIDLLSRLDPSEPLYIGSPGFGRDNDLERIKLFPHERYCMGGPGVIFSRALLIQLVPHLDECLRSVVVSWNEDLEVGRCISRKLDIQCTWSFEARNVFFMDYSKGEMFKNSKIYRDKRFTSVISAHPFKSSNMMYRVHQFFLEIKIRNNNRENQSIKKELDKVKLITMKDKAFP
jgi:hypothetical protein